MRGYIIFLSRVKILREEPKKNVYIRKVFIMNENSRRILTVAGALDAGISLHYSAVDGDPEKRLSKGDVVRITYNGMIMESYPVQIAADSVEKAE